MADLATLAIKVENTDVVKATTSLESMAVAGGKTEAAAQRLTRRLALLEIEARQMDADMQRGGKAMLALETEARRMDAELNQAARAMALVEIEARKMDAEIGQSAVRAMVAAQAEAQKLDAELSKSARAMALLEIEAHKMDAAFMAAAQANRYLSRDLALAQAEALKMDAAMGKAGQGMSQLSGIAVRLAAVFAAYKLVQFGTETLNLAARYQTLGVAMDVVGKSAGVNAGRMATLQGEMQKTGISAIESRLALTRLVQAHIDLADATKLARIAQDAAVIGNVNSSEALGTLIHGIQSAQTDVLRTIGINVNFESSYKKLATQLHTTTDALTEVQKTQARVGAVMAAGKDIAGTYEAAMGTVGKQLTSTTRYLEDMRVKVGTAFLPEYAQTVKAYADSLNRLADNAPVVIGVVTGIASAVGALALVLKGSAIVSGIGAIGAAIAAIGASPLIVVTGALAALGVVVGSFATDAALARREAAEFSETLKHLPDAALVRNIDRTAVAIADLNDEIAKGGAPTKSQSEQLAILNDRLKQYSAQHNANAGATQAGAAAKDAAATAAAEAAAAAARADAAKRAEAAAKAYTQLMEELTDATRTAEEAEVSRQVATAKSSADAVASITQERAESDLLLEAAAKGEEAYKTQQREIEILNKLTAAGLKLGDERYEQAKRDLEITYENADAIGAQSDARKKAEEEARRAEDAAIRAQEQRAKQFSRNVSNAITGALDSIGQKGANFWQSWWDAGKKGLSRFIGDAVGQLANEKFGAAFGVGPTGAAQKQNAAGVLMVNAAKMQLQAAMLMSGGGASVAGLGETVNGHGGIADASVGGTSRFGTAVGGAAVIAGGVSAGYGVGGSLYKQTAGGGENTARGALGGAAAGAAAGAVLGSVVPGIGTAIGAVVGGLAGVVGGLLGVGNAAKEAAKMTTAATQAVQKSLASFSAEVYGDDLDQKLIAAEDRFRDMSKAIQDAWPGNQADRVAWRAAREAELLKTQEAYVAKLREENALKLSQASEDYHVRYLRATGQDKAAAQEEFSNSQTRERESLVKSFGESIDAQEAATLAAYDQTAAAERAKFATDQNTKAINDLTTSVNTVTGFKLDDLKPYLQEFAKGRPYPGSEQSNPFPVPTNPFVPPTSPLTPPMALSASSSPMGSQTGTVATQPLSITIAPGAIVINESKTPELTATTVTRMVLTKIDEERNARDGLSGSRSAALERLKLPPGGTPWRS